MILCKKNLHWALAAAIVLASAHLEAAAKLPHIFSDNMVLQRDKPVPVWGWANKGEVVKVKFGKQEKSATADENGKWSLALDATPADKTAADLVVSGENTITFKNV